MHVVASLGFLIQFKPTPSATLLRAFYSGSFVKQKNRDFHKPGFSIQMNAIYSINLNPAQT
jgi:hypothetical protein